MSTGSAGNQQGTVATASQTMHFSTAEHYELFTSDNLNICLCIMLEPSVIHTVSQVLT